MATIAELKVKLGLDKRDYDKGMKDAEVTASRALDGMRVSAFGLASAFGTVVAGIGIATGALGKFAQRGDKSLEAMGVEARNAGDAFAGLTITMNSVIDAAARRVAGSESLITWFDGLAGALDASASAAGRFLDRQAQIQQQIDVFHGIGPMFEQSGSEAFFGTQASDATGPSNRSAEMEAFRASLQAVREEGALAVVEYDNLNQMIQIMTDSLTEVRVGEINPLTGALVDFGTEGQLLSSTFLPDLTGEINKSATATTVYKIAADAAKESTDEWKLSLSGLTGALGGISGILSGFGIGVPFLGNIFSIASGTDLLSSIFGGGKDMRGKSIPGRAHGGPVGAGTAYMVGERGPEMFVPRQSGTIVPNGGVTINVPPARDPITFARDQQWQRAIAETFRELESGGFRAAGA